MARAISTPETISSPRRLALLSGERLQRLVLYVVAYGLAALFLLPFAWAILSSLKSPAEIAIFPPRWLPESPQWSNYVTVWQQVPLGRFYLNTIIVTGSAVVGQVLSSTLVAYGFARFRFPGREALFMLVIATLILPEEVLLIPRFILFRQINWLDTYLPLTVPYWFGSSAFSIFLMRQFLRSIPRELDEAAEIDGAGSLRILWSILLPLIAPAMATVALFAFIFHWDDFIHPLIYLRSTEKFTLTLGLRFFQQAAESGSEPREALLMAASLLVIAPCIILFFIAQRYFVRGIVMSGLKG
jgi:multiple sugar transport system permease protein